MCLPRFRYNGCIEGSRWRLRQMRGLWEFNLFTHPQAVGFAVFIELGMCDNHNPTPCARA